MRSAGRVALFTVVVVGLGLSMGCLGPKGDSVQAKRNHVREMRDEALVDLKAVDSTAPANLRNGAGYAVFRSVTTKIFLLSPGQGYGLAVDNSNGRETFMRMGEIGAGPGLGIKDMRIIFVFRDRDTMVSFIENGYQFGGEGDVAAKAGDTGGTVGAQTKVVDGGAAIGGTGAAEGDAQDVSAGAGMDVYQLTENGLALAATVRGTKYWKDGDLNAK